MAAAFIVRGKKFNVNCHFMMTKNKQRRKCENYSLKPFGVPQYFAHITLQFDIQKRTVKM